MLSDDDFGNFYIGDVSFIWGWKYLVIFSGEKECWQSAV